MMELQRKKEAFVSEKSHSFSLGTDRQEWAATINQIRRNQSDLRSKHGLAGLNSNIKTNDSSL